MDHRLRQPASHWRASRSPHASCPYSGAERRELPAQAIEGKAAVCDPTRRRGRLGGRSRDRRNHPRFLKATAAPATTPRPSPPGRPWRVVLDAHAANWPVFAPPQWPAFTPPLTVRLHDDGPRGDAVAVADVADLQSDEIASAQLAVDTKVESSDIL